jgi:hypothetical protein
VHPSVIVLTSRRLAVAALAAAVLPAGAGAVTLGSTVAPTAFPSLRCDQPIWGTGHVYYQAVTLPGMASSAAPTSGAITSWRSNQYGSGDPGGTLALVVVHPTETGVRVVAADQQLLPATIGRGDLVFTPARPVPIAAGDLVGIWGPDEHSGCQYSGGERTEAVARAAIGPTLSAGASYPVIQQSFGRVDLAAELGAALPDPTPDPGSPTGTGAPSGGGGGDPTPATPTPGTPTTPFLPIFGPDGKPLVSTKGSTVTVDTGQNAGCSEAGPCIVITTAVVYYGTGGSVAARAAAKPKPKPKKPVVVGTRRFTIPAGGNADVTFPLNATGRRTLAKQGKLRLAITTTIRQGTAAPVTAKRTITVKRPRATKKATKKR